MESTTVLPPKSALELEAELAKAHAMIGRLMMLIFEHTDLDAEMVVASLHEAAS